MAPRSDTGLARPAGGAQAGGARRAHVGTLVGLASIALVVVFANQPGAYIPDFRVEVAWSPGRTLSKITQLWDTTGGLGRVAGAERGVFPTLVFGASRALGLEPWAAQRLWHAALLFVAGSGSVQLLRWFRPNVGWWHGLAALAYMFSPFAVGSFQPSTIFAAYAISPWLIASLLHGTTSGTPWKWAGAFALSLVAVVPTELPGAVYDLALLPIAAIYLVHVERAASWRRVLGWVARATALSTGTLMFVLARSVLDRDALVSRVLSTETPEATAIASSYSEAFRGLGNWLTYFDFGGSRPRPHLASMLDSPVVVAATFVVPLVAASMVFLSRWRGRTLFAVVMLVSLIVVVGLHPVDDPTPWGRLVGWLYDTVPSTSAFRNTMKAGTGVALGSAVLFAAAAVALARRLRLRLARAAVGVASVTVIVTASWPAWSGNLYPPDGTIKELPDYWLEASAYVDALPGAPRMLVLPGSSTTVYRWGRFSDDLFEGVFRTPFVRGNAFASSAPHTANLTLAIDERLSSNNLESGSIVPIVRRLGVEYVLIRNDLLWEETRLVRPARLADIRLDPGLELVASFGASGENTTPSAGDDEPLDEPILYEQTLPPVELYRVLAPAPQIRTTAGLAPLLVAGDGRAWFELEAAGLLRDTHVVSYLPDLTTQELIDALGNGGVVAITDSNRRRETRALGPSVASGPVAFGVESLRADGGLFVNSSEQTVLWTEDAVQITASSPNITQPWAGVAQAFDRDLESAWRVPPLVNPTGESILISLADATGIDLVTVDVADTTRRPIVDVFVELDDGTRQTQAVDKDNRASFDLNGLTARSVRVGIAAVEGEGLEQVGFAEIDIDRAELMPFLQVPTSFFDRIDRFPSLESAVADRPLAYLFEREAGAGVPPTEASLRRRFRLATARTFSLEGRFVPGDIGFIEGGCVPWVEIDDVPIAIRVTAPPDPTTLTVPFESCTDVTLVPGWHTVRHSPLLTINRLALIDTTLDLTLTEHEASSLQVLSATPSEIRVEVTVPEGGATLVSGMAYHPAWRAQIDGDPIDVVATDTQVGIALAEEGTHEILLRFGPQRLYDLAWGVSALAIAISLGAVLRRQQ